MSVLSDFSAAESKDHIRYRAAKCVLEFFSHGFFAAYRFFAYGKIGLDEKRIYFYSLDNVVMFGIERCFHFVFLLSFTVCGNFVT